MYLNIFYTVPMLFNVEKPRYMYKAIAIILNEQEI